MTTVSAEREAAEQKLRRDREQILSALEVGIAALSQVPGADHAKRELVGARNAYRITAPPIESEVIDRVQTVLPAMYGDLVTWLLNGGVPASGELVDDAHIIAGLLAAVGENEIAHDPKDVSQWGMYLERVLSMAKRLESYEVDRRFAEDKRRREREEEERRQRDNSPAGRVDVIGFMAGINERGRALLERDLEDLEAQDQHAAEIVRALLEAGNGAALSISDGPTNTAVTLSGRDGRQDRHWIVSPETAEALSPLVARSGEGRTHA